MTPQPKKITKYYNPALFEGYLLDSDENLYSLLKYYQTYDKTFQVDPCSNYDVKPKTTKYYNPTFVSKLLHC